MSETTREAVVHRCPDGTGGLTPCCGRTVFELPRSDRITLIGDLVTCWTGSDPRLVGLLDTPE